MESLYTLLKKKKDVGEQARPAQDGVMTEKVIKDKIINTLVSLYKGNQEVIKGKMLVFYENNMLEYPIVSSQEFHDSLLTALVSSGLEIFDVAFTDEPSPEGAAKITDSISASIKESHKKATTNTVLAKQATIRINRGKGSLAKKCYVIKDTDCPYFIGRDSIDRQGNKAISINGNTNDPQYELNKFVRSHHAQIHYNPSLGFYLLVEKDGTRVYGKNRTQIRRNGSETIELDNPQQLVKLCDGDVIVLGKSVELLYTE